MKSETTVDVKKIKSRRGVIITYFDIDDNITRQGIIEDEDHGAFLIFTPSITTFLNKKKYIRSKKKWIYKKDIRIYMIHHDALVFPGNSKSFDHVQNNDIIHLLDGGITSIIINEYNLPNFRKLFQVIKPILGIRTLSLEGINESVNDSIISFFPNVIDLQIVNCPFIQWSSVKTLGLKRFIIDGMETNEESSISNILCRYINVKLEVLIVKNIQGERNLDYCFEGLKDFVVANCDFYTILKDKEFKYPNLSFVRFCNLPNLNYINPELIHNCRTIHFSNVPSFSQDFIFQHCDQTKEIIISETGFLQCPCLSACTQLTSLSLSFQSWKVLPDELKNCKELNDFEVRSCSELQIIPDSYHVWKNLSYLKLSDSPINKIPTALLKNCKVAIILNCIALDVFEEVGESIERLVLDSLPIHKLPYNISCLKNLKEICLFSLDLQSFPQNWTYSENLQRFTIRNLPFPRFNREPLYFNEKCQRTLTFHASCFSPIYCTLFDFKCLMLEKNKIVLPEHLRCLICHSFLKNPSIDSVGYTYCESCIREWFSIRMIDPHTNQFLQSGLLFPNKSIEKLSHEFLKMHTHLFSPNYLLTSEKYSSVHESKY